MIGKPQELGGTVKHSLAHVVLQPKTTSSPHYHNTSEETYYVLRGKARMIIDNNEFTLSPGEACLIMPGETHQIFNDGNKDLEFLAICAPAWTPEDSFSAE